MADVPVARPDGDVLARAICLAPAEITGMEVVSPSNIGLWSPNPVPLGNARVDLEPSASKPYIELFADRF